MLLCCLWGSEKWFLEEGETPLEKRKIGGVLGWWVVWRYDNWQRVVTGGGGVLGGGWLLH